MCEDSGPAQVSGYSRPEQIVVQALIGTRRKTQRRKTKWSDASSTYIGGYTDVMVEIESTLSFPPAKPIAAVAKIGIATEDCRACFDLAAGWPRAAPIWATSVEDKKKIMDAKITLFRMPSLRTKGEKLISVMRKRTTKEIKNADIIMKTSMLA